MAAIDTTPHFSFHAPVVKLALAVLCLLLIGCASVPPPTRQVEQLKSLPIALNPDFSFRKTKQYFLDPRVQSVRGIDASVAFERSYHNYGAITALDLREHIGSYYTFFWRARRPANVTVRLEYRQEKLHAFTQAREVRYEHAHGSYQTHFAIIGDDYYNDGRVIAWRASLIAGGRIVAMSRSYLWE
jgi:hypothetical protein